MRSTLSAAVVTGFVLALCTDAVAFAAHRTDWKPCAEVASGWDQEDRRTECAMVEVPLDHAKPDGRRIEIAVSRVKATGDRTGVILVNPGGPGQQGVTMPLGLAESDAGGIGVHHDLVGFDPRGIGYSTAVECDPDRTQPDPALSPKERARFTAERDAARNRECFDRDPDLVRSMTTENIARDMDVIRKALGEKKIGYYGVSWGTGLGAMYRTLFDANVSRMLLDSVVPPVLDVRVMDDGQVAAGENTFHEFAAWIARYEAVYHLGRTQTAVVQALLDLRAEVTAHPRTMPDGSVVDGDAVSEMFAYPRRDWAYVAAQLKSIRDVSAAPRRTGGLGWDAGLLRSHQFPQTAILCNDSPSTRDFETVWRHREERVTNFPAVGRFASYERMCVGWPTQGKAWDLKPGTSQVQLVGHLYEPVTPIGWAIEMRARVGGELMTVLDDEHGTVHDRSCADDVVRFFDTGRTTTRSCAGAPVPAP
ncbi:TAP-like protein [Lentzea fradiae]|uniref:TAP-like protein n=1 Tax=Lentzea fradiae TaxID=200378 RepID=A0A1G7R1Y3_9PSEU|nr:alpha/beta fold hydrolase [Lentzea fradiae]SDG04747.1 TAP-like protein [Lentzea fradiae]